VFNILLQVLEDGRLTDSHGKTADFRNTVIIMTSNVGSGSEQKRKTIGFGTGLEGSITYEREKEEMTAELKRVFRPEFLNRIDDIVIFRKLDSEDTEKIARIMLAQVCDRLGKREIYADFDDAAVAHMAKSGFDEQYGARPLRRAVSHEIEDGLSEEILSGRIGAGGHVLITAEDGRLRFIIRQA